MIDLAYEFRNMIQHESGLGLGRWIILRHFDKARLNMKYWNEKRHEAVGGPKYEYTDTLVRAYSAATGFGMAMTSDGLTQLEPVSMPTSAEAYYFENDIVIDLNDIIFELDWDKKDKPAITYDPRLEDKSRSIVCPKRKGEVMKIIPLCGDTAGRVSFWKVFIEEHSI